MATKNRQPATLTSARIKHLAGLGLEDPAALSDRQTRELAGSVMRHIEKQKKEKEKAKRK